MYEIVSREQLAPRIVKLQVRAPRVAKTVKPGQFIVLRVDQTGERFPLTVVEHNHRLGILTLVVQTIGSSTEKLASLEPGEKISDLLGPLGEPSEIDYYGRVLCVGGGVGTALILPVARALSANGNEVVTLLGARTEQLLIFTDELAEFSQQLLITTDDGSAGSQGNVAEKLTELLESGERFDRVYATGPVPMMRAIADITEPYAIKTLVSLNPIMVDGTGMCGGCRVQVGDRLRFACTEGPEFDGHQVDFADLLARQNYYSDSHNCRLPDFSEDGN